MANSQHATKGPRHMPLSCRPDPPPPPPPCSSRPPGTAALLERNMPRLRWGTVINEHCLLYTSPSPRD
eukprot:11469594-Alexandrium_andersonii.AAC.1